MNKPFPNEQELGLAVGLLVQTVNLLVPTVGELADRVDDAELRKRLADGIDICMKAMHSLMEMFPAPEDGVLH